ncbi:MAG TPA: hypothetical protein VMR41_03035, partial [Patescibacteria group bacterium]|nr:hypothetical protein [Patescibacteria group bacterium]
MKKIIISLTTLIAPLAVVAPAFAVNSNVSALNNVAISPIPASAGTTIQPCASGAFSILCTANLTSAVGSFITIAFVLALLIALAYLIWGGIRWILSRGEKEGV